MFKRKYWIFIFILLFTLFFFLAPLILISVRPQIRDLLLVYFASIGSLLLFLKFMGFKLVREYILLILANKYVDDQFEMMVILAGIAKNNLLVHKYYEESKSENFYFKEAIFMGADIQSEYEYDKAKAYLTILNGLIEDKLIEGLSKELVIINIIKIAYIISVNSEDVTVEKILIKFLKNRRSLNSFYYKFLKSHDKTFVKALDYSKLENLKI